MANEISERNTKLTFMNYIKCGYFGSIKKGFELCYISVDYLEVVLNANLTHVSRAMYLQPRMLIWKFVSHNKCEALRFLNFNVHITNRYACGR